MSENLEYAHDLIAEQADQISVFEKREREYENTLHNIAGDHDLPDGTILARAAMKATVDQDARIAELEAIVSKLPVTADGVPVVPGMVVWFVDPQSRGRPARSMTVRRVSIDLVYDYCGGQPYFVRDGSQPIWSTEHLALQHRASEAMDVAESAARAAAEKARDA